MSRSELFTEFVAETGERIKHGLMALLGPEVGSDAAAEALSYAWEHWERIEAMNNPAGYLFVVGRNHGRQQSKLPMFPPVRQPDDGDPHAPAEQAPASCRPEGSERHRQQLPAQCAAHRD